MHLTVPTKKFLEDLRAAASVVPSRTPKEILKTVKMIVGDKVTLVASDGEVSLRHDVAEGTVREDGTVLLPPQRLVAILSETTESEVVLESDGDKLTCKAGRNRFDLQATDSDEFPDVAEFDGKSAIQIGAASLTKAINRTTFACDAESTRYALGGVLFESVRNSMILAATDSRRLAVETIPAKGLVSGRPVVPALACRLIAQMAKDGDVLLDFDPNSLAVKAGRSTIRARLIEGRFPKWQDVIPRDAEHSVEFVVGPLLSAVRQSMIVTNEESRGVDFTLGAGSLRLSSVGADIGTANVELPVSSDAEIAFTIDPKFARDWLATRDVGEVVTLNIKSPTDALVWRVGESQYVVMPLAREG